MNLTPWVRIVVRIAGGVLVGYGYATEDQVAEFLHPEIVGGIAIALSEAWYLIAKKKGAPT